MAYKWELNEMLKGLILNAQTPGDPNEYNPALMPVNTYNPWEGQGTVIDTGGGRSMPDDKPDFWDRYGSDIIQSAPALFCLVAPKSQACQQRQESSNNGNTPTTNNSPWMLFLGALIVLLLLILIFRK